ncbi:MAG: addiction module toxin, HicA family [Anaerolineae bacterium]|nr:addiction module toxin, HicA family [Anaerolineae bacterium]
MTYRIFVQESPEGGYTAIVPELPGCISEGVTKKDAVANACKAVALYLEPVSEEGRVQDGPMIPEPTPMDDLLRSLERQGWRPVRRRGTHIRLHNQIGDEVLVMIIPLADKMLDSTLLQIMKRATVDVHQTRQSVWGPQGREKLHAVWKGRRMRAVGSRLYLRPEQETFHEFLVWMFSRMLHPRWLRQEPEREGTRQHEISRWFRAYQQWREDVKRPENQVEGGWRMSPSGDVQSLICLAYDVYQLLHSGNFSGKVFRRLRNFEHFQGARYEIAVAAILSRLEYKLTYPGSGTSQRHPEFIAEHPRTGNRIAVEAKSRHRPGVLHTAGSRDPQEPTARELIFLFEHALPQCPDHLPAAIFIDLNVPPPRTGASRRWFEELLEAFKGEIGTSGPGKLDSFNVLFLTNFPYHWVGSDRAPSTQRGYITSFQPRHRFPMDLIAEIYEAVENYGIVPEERF